MRLTYLAYTFSLVIRYFSLVLLFPIIVALIFHENNSILPFVAASLSAFLISWVIKRIVKGTECIKSVNDIKKSEGLTVVTFSWIFAILFASIPYLFFGLQPINALFGLKKMKGDYFKYFHCEIENICRKVKGKK